MINKNTMMAELMAMPRPNRRRIQEIIRMIWEDGRSWTRKNNKRLKSIDPHIITAK